MTRPPYDEWLQGNSAGTYSTPVDKLLIHTTEGGSISGAVAAYQANNSWPHLTVDCRYGKVPWRVGHLDLSVPARALRNEAGGVETNRDGVIQIEVVGSATDPAAINWDWFGEHVAWPICVAMNIPWTSTVSWVAYPASYGRVAPQRLPGHAWTAYTGILGHQHAPENSHGDPGAIPIDRVLAAAPVSQHPSEEDDDIMYRVIGVKGDARRPFMALRDGFVVKFTDNPELVNTTNAEVWAPKKEYDAGVRTKYLREVEYVNAGDYDNTAVLAKRTAV